MKSHYGLIVILFLLPINIVYAELPNPIIEDPINCNFKDEYIQGFFIHFNCSPSENLDYFYVELSQNDKVFFENTIDIRNYYLITTQKTPLGDIQIKITAIDKSELFIEYVQESTIFLKPHSGDMIWAEIDLPNTGNSYYIIPEFLKEYKISFPLFFILIVSLSLIGFGLIMLFYNKIYVEQIRESVGR